MFEYIGIQYKLGHLNEAQVWAMSPAFITVDQASPIITGVETNDDCKMNAHSPSSMESGHSYAHQSVNISLYVLPEFLSWTLFRPISKTNLQLFRLGSNPG